MTTKSTPLTAADLERMRETYAPTCVVGRLLAERDALAAQVREATGSFANWTEHDRAIENAKLRGQIFDLESQLAAARGIARRYRDTHRNCRFALDQTDRRCVTCIEFDDVLHWSDPKEP